MKWGTESLLIVVVIIAIGNILKYRGDGGERPCSGSVASTCTSTPYNLSLSKVRVQLLCGTPTFQSNRL